MLLAVTIDFHLPSTLCRLFASACVLVINIA